MPDRVFLRQSLFTFTGDQAHLPVGVAVVVGSVKERDAFGLMVAADSYLDEKGRKLAGKKATLLLTAAKIDHVWME